MDTPCLIWEISAKESFIDGLASGTRNYESIVPSNSAVRVYGDTALVTGNADVKVDQNAFSLRFTDVCVRKDGR